ncbi:hypothetical protein YC2023_066584 [Brassica napus]
MNVVYGHKLLRLGSAQKTVTTIQVADKEKGVVLETTKTKKQSKLKLYVNKSVLKEFPMMAKTVANQVRLDSLEDLLDFMAVDNPLMKNTLNARRGPLDAMISSRIHGSRPSETEHPPNYFENVIP